jgi:hypothetical protein
MTPIRSKASEMSEAAPGHFLRNISDPFREIWCHHSAGLGVTHLC